MYSKEQRVIAIITIALFKKNYEKAQRFLVENNICNASVSTLKRWNSENNWDKDMLEKIERALEVLLANIPQELNGKDWAVAVGILLDKWMQIAMVNQTTDVLVLTDEEKRLLSEKVRKLLSSTNRDTDLD